MFNLKYKLSIGIFIILLHCHVVLAKDNSEINKQKYVQKSLNTEQNDSTIFKWPTHFSILQTGIINSVFTENGTFGSAFGNFSGVEPYASNFPLSFETPQNSSKEYLFTGAIWVGAVVGNDTLVSTGFEGWNTGNNEFGNDNKNKPTVTKFNYNTDESYRSQFTDTVTSGIARDEVSGNYFTPLSVRISSRVHLFKTQPLNNGLYHDLLIDYIGPEDKLDSVYIGFYFDPDIQSTNGIQGYTDDIVGTVKERNIVYSIDNDGDPWDNNFWDSSVVKVFAFELLASSMTPADTNFNWWTSNTSSNFDFGPRLKGTPEDPFRTFPPYGLLGTPSGDVNKYYMLKHHEWDYDQIYNAVIDSMSEFLIPPDTTIAKVYAKGADIRFLYSIGPITLEKGKSERIIFANYTIDSMHVKTNNISSLPYNPEQYKSNLNIDDLLQRSEEIKQGLDLIVNPLNPPINLQIYDYNKIKFDPYVFEDVTGYEVYATPIDTSQFPFPGCFPPWYFPQNPILIGSSLIEIPQESIDGITAVQVAHTSLAGKGELSQPAYIYNKNNLLKPIITTSFTTTIPDSITINWTLDSLSEKPDHYKIYKFSTLSEFENIYTTPYYLEGVKDHFTTDSILVDSTWWFYQSALETPYATLDGSSLSFTDYNFDNDYIYFVIAVDKNGFDSDFAKGYGFLIPERTYNFLLILKNKVSVDGKPLTYALDYYKSLFDGTEMSYEIYSIADSVSDSVCTSQIYDECITWQTMSKYDYVIIDDIEYVSKFMTEEFYLYLVHGGKIAAFGNLTNFANLYIPAWSPIKYPTYHFDYFGIDSIFNLHPIYYSVHPDDDRTLGFNMAQSVDINFPSVECDTSKFPLDTYWLNYNLNLYSEPLSVSGFKPQLNSEVTHIYKSLTPNTSYLQDIAVGVHHLWSDGINSHDVFSFGFHLYYMKIEQARDLLRAILQSVPTDVEEITYNQLPSRYSLSQNYPNPFNPSTSIEFSIPTKSHVKITIYNLLGQVVDILVNKEYSAGNYRVNWDTSSNSKKQISSGIYFYKFETDEYISAKKMLLLK